jgi:hypothetical protein
MRLDSRLRGWRDALAIVWLALAASFGCGTGGDAAADAGRDGVEGGEGGGGEGGGGAGGEGGGAGASHEFLDEDGALPPLLSDLGLYPDMDDLEQTHPATLRYVPRYALWSNGGAKDRLVHIPAGMHIDNSDPEHWDFPDGTIFFKTFSFEDEDGVLRPIETRLILKTDGQWSYALYVWNDDASDAEQSDMRLTQPVTVYHDGEAFEHVVPSSRDCDKCHESDEDFVIGFDELRLNHPLQPDDAVQLEALAEDDFFSEPLRDVPETIEHDDADTRAVLGYIHGNCAHCHNGRDGPSNAYDLRHPVALDNLIDRGVESEGLSGTRVVPGDPEASVLYLSFIRDESDPELRPMPPVGVQRIDEEAVTLIRDWIEAL